MVKREFVDKSESINFVSAALLALRLTPVTLLLWHGACLGLRLGDPRSTGIAFVWLEVGWVVVGRWMQGVGCEGSMLTGWPGYDTVSSNLQSC